MEQFTFHVISLPHTQTSKEYLPCAYTQKVINFCKMMKSLNHKVFLYASEDNDAPCDELITCITKQEQEKSFDKEWKSDFFKIEWDCNISYWKSFNEKAISEMEKRINKKDFICLIGGVCQEPIARAFPQHMSVEFGVGYKGIFSKYRVFESYAWMHHVYGLQGIENGQSYDCVIPNYFNPEDFPFSNEKEDYFLYIGRFISRKGIQLAADVCNHLGVKLVMAGQGVLQQKDGKIVSKEITISGENITHVGVVDAKIRGDLMSKARGVFVPTQYIGPLEGVSIEAMMCGTPVITSDWGCFAETVVDGFNGYRVRTLGEAVWAAENVDFLPYENIRASAVNTYSIDVIKYRYQDYFKQLSTLWGGGWYDLDYTGLDKRIEGNFV